MTIARKIFDCLSLTFAAIAIAFALIVTIGISGVAARDTTGLSDSLTQEQRDWVRGLKSGNGISCCDDADGIDPEWRIRDDHYEVRHEGTWLIVEAEALLTKKNELGVARAWIGFREGGPFVRCFLPGSTI